MFHVVLVRRVHENSNIMNYGLGQSLLNASRTNAKVQFLDLVVAYSNEGESTATQKNRVYTAMSNDKELLTSEGVYSSLS